MQAELQRVRDWAQEKAQNGEEPPWAWYQYMKLIETCDAILSGMAASTPEGSPGSESHQAKHLRLVAHNGSQETSQYRPDQPASGPLPM